MGWFQRRAANFVLLPMNAFPFFFWWIPTSDRSWERTFGKGTPPCSAGRNSTPMAMDIKGTLFGSMDRFLKKRRNCVPGKGIRWFMETQRDSKPQVIPPKSNRASAAISLCQKEPFGKNHPKPPQKTASLARGHGPKVPQVGADKFSAISFRLWFLMLMCVSSNSETDQTQASVASSAHGTQKPS